MLLFVGTGQQAVGNFMPHICQAECLILSAFWLGSTNIGTGLLVSHFSLKMGTAVLSEVSADQPTST
jgi:hypothetical protein